ncbi:hypothetical protein BDP81DRAFT_440855 [Colletotrichum phormii]|uniref:Uncharacterized protein n=1 Tax=Colletotrichum phormii TaxID=359342 RepID=A0AAI9ZEG6_9PEZI|nr:uncharacterized protein BDP81DRAFT_440855 [Colletotrichum phormii]KAK1622792.1 hypothetical protein BDP81DRAFT_440855 [Colletotrichum phormii]
MSTSLERFDNVHSRANEIWDTSNSSGWQRTKTHHLSRTAVTGLQTKPSAHLSGPFPSNA